MWELNPGRKVRFCMQRMLAIAPLGMFLSVDFPTGPAIGKNPYIAKSSLVIEKCN